MKELESGLKAIVRVDRVNECGEWVWQGGWVGGLLKG